MDSFVAPITANVPEIKGTNLIGFLRQEQRQKLNNDNRWSLFDRHSPDQVTAGSILRVTYLNSHTESARPATFTGILIALRRHPAEPTMLLRTIIDDVGVEQVFPVMSPLIKKIEVMKRAIKRKGNKIYWLRDNPHKAAEFITPKSKKQSKK